MIQLRDEFLSEEDLDLRSMTESELYAYWDMWLRQAQATNAQDSHVYSHGVFTSVPGVEAMSGGSVPLPASAELSRTGNPRERTI